MSTATKALLTALIRLSRGVLSECEKWVNQQPATDELNRVRCDDRLQAIVAPASPLSNERGDT